MTDQVAFLRRETRVPYSDPDYAQPTSAEFASVLRETQLSGARAAQIVGVNGRRVREWIGGARDIPYSAWRLLLDYSGFALGIDLGTRRIADLCETLDVSLRRLEMFNSGEMKVGFGPPAATAESSAPALMKLQRDIEQLQAHVDWMRAIARRSEASFGSEWNEAERDVRLARERVDHVRKTIRETA